MAKRFFKGIDHAALYAKFRPKPPESIAKSIFNFLNMKVSFNFDILQSAWLSPRLGYET